MLILSFLVPAVIFGAVSGVYVDRLDRRLILVSTNLLRGLLFLAIIVAPNNLLVIYLVTALVATLTTFFGPAEAAMIPAVVPRHQLLPANSLYILTLQASFFLGFALLGPLVLNLTGMDVLLLIVAVSYFIGAALCVLLPSQNPRLPAEHEGGAFDEAGRALGEARSAVRTTFAQLVDGVRFITANHTIFWPLTYLAVTASLIGVLGVLGPGFATQVLGLSERDFVVVVLPLGVGLVMGILLLNVYGRLFSRRRGIEGGLIALGITLLGTVDRPAADDHLLAGPRHLAAVGRHRRRLRGRRGLRVRRGAGADAAAGGAARRRARTRVRRAQHAREHRLVPADHHRRPDCRRGWYAAGGAGCRGRGAARCRGLDHARPAGQRRGRHGALESRRRGRPGHGHGPFADAANQPGS